MPHAALRRAQKMMEARGRSLPWIHVLTIAQTLLFFALVSVVGLIIALMSTRGIARVTSAFVQAEANHKRSLPNWLSDQIPASSVALASQHWVHLIPDTGVYPLVIDGRSSGLISHHALASLLDTLTRWFSPLRDTRGALITLLMTGLAVMLVLNLVSRLRRAWAIEAVSHATRNMRHQIHRQMYRLGQTALPGEGIGPVVNIFSRDVNEVRDGLYAQLIHGWSAPMIFGGFFVLALMLSPWLTIFIASLGGIIWLASLPLERARREAIDNASRAAAIQLLQLHEDLSMLRTVRVFGMESVDNQRFEEHLDEYQAADKERSLHNVNRSPALVLSVAASGLLALGMLAFSVLRGTTGMATAVVLAGALGGLAFPVFSWITVRGVLRKARRAARGVFEFLERKPELQMTVGAQFLAPLRERIVLDKVSIEGPTGRTLISGVSATIPARSRTAFLSLDEDAKHAIVCLIPRLIDPKIGQVRIDGLDLREVTLESLRAQVSMLLQADYVFSDSVLNNIGLGDESYNLPRVIEAAKVAHAHHFVQELPDGYETVIGPLGHPLRLDEQYRIALARAYLHDPSIVVVEEPNAPFDEDIKHLFDDTIDRLAKGRTLIFLPHRLSTIRKCDQVIVLHNGRLEAVGPPRDLHTQSQLFRHIQYVEFNQFASGEIEAGQLS